MGPSQERPLCFCSPSQIPLALFPWESSPSVNTLNPHSTHPLRATWVRRTRPARKCVGVRQEPTKTLLTFETFIRRRERAAACEQPSRSRVTAHYGHPCLRLFRISFPPEFSFVLGLGSWSWPARDADHLGGTVNSGCVRQYLDSASCSWLRGGGGRPRRPQRKRQGTVPSFVSLDRPGFRHNIIPSTHSESHADNAVGIITTSVQLSARASRTYTVLSAYQNSRTPSFASLLPNTAVQFPPYLYLPPCYLPVQHQPLSFVTSPARCWTLFTWQFPPHERLHYRALPCSCIARPPEKEKRGTEKRQKKFPTTSTPYRGSTRPLVPIHLLLISTKTTEKTPSQHTTPPPSPTHSRLHMQRAILQSDTAVSLGQPVIFFWDPLLAGRLFTFTQSRAHTA